MPDGLVDWGMAERVARVLSGTGPRWDGSEEELRRESDRAAALVRRYTGLKPKSQLPPAELVDRSEWAEVNLETFRDLSVRVEDHLEERMSKNGNSGSKGIQRTIVGAATGAEIGLALGYLSQRGIGQYDVALIGPMGKIKDELPKWKDTCLTTMMVAGPPQMMRTAAKTAMLPCLPEVSAARRSIPSPDLNPVKSVASVKVSLPLPPAPAARRPHWMDERRHIDVRRHPP